MVFYRIWNVECVSKGGSWNWGASLWHGHFIFSFVIFFILLILRLPFARAKEGVIIK